MCCSSIDPQGELAEEHVLLKECLGAHQDIDLSGGDLQQQGGAVALGHPPRQQPAANLTGRQQPVKTKACCRASASVGTITAAWHPWATAKEHGVYCNDRLARPHISLEQPVHRHFVGHVRRDLSDRLPLDPGSLEGKQPADSGIDLRGGLQTYGPPSGSLPLPLYGQCQLEDEQLLVDESPLCLFQRLHAGGKLDFFKARPMGQR